MSWHDLLLVEIHTGGLVPRFKQRLMIICGLLAAELADDWFQGLSKGR